MNRKHLAQASLLAVIVMSIASCSTDKFHVKGEITQAKDSVLYFENMSLQGPVVIDSVKLDNDGSFDFSDERPDAPEFYRLRIANQIVNISIDSTETVTIKAQYPTMPTQYTVEGSDNCNKIKELALKQIALTSKAMQLERNNSFSSDEVRDSLGKMLASYKSMLINNYIFKAPNKPYAYFALFQTLGDYLIFNPKNNKDDIKVFAAVATSWDTYYPNAERGANLHNIAIEGMKNERIIAAKQAQSINQAQVTETGVLDIALTDNKGNLRKLTDLKGKVVLLDFHVFGMKDSPKRILMLRELYNKYHTQGFEIYQVALDNDEHFWKTSTAALPWISVRDEDGINSQRLVMYNVQSLPEYFLIDRGNNLVKRSSQMKSLEEEIKNLL